MNFTIFSDGVVLKLFPVKVTLVPTTPEAGVNPDNAVSRTVKSADELAVLPPTVTVIFPEEAVGGTTTVSSVADATVTAAATPLNVTWLFEAVV